MPTYEIEFERDGKTMVMDVEGDRPPTEDEAQGLIQQHLSQGETEPVPARGYQPATAPATSTPTAPTGTGTTPDQPGTSIGPMAYGAVQGLSDVASLPETIGSLLQFPQRAMQNLMARALPESIRPPEQPLFEEPKAGKFVEKQARNLLNKVGIPDESLDPDTRTEQFIQRVVREVTGTVVALPAVRALSAAARTAPIAGELAMGAAQGVGAATAQQIAPGNLAAEVAGQMAPNAASLVRALSRNVGTRLIPDPDALRNQVTQALRETTGDLDQAGENLQRTLATQGTVPGLQPTLPEATGAPGLLSLQRSQRAADPALAGRLTERRTQNIDAVTDALDEMFKGGGPEDVRSSLMGTQKRVQQRLADRTQKAQQRLARVQETAQARLTRSQARINERITKAQGEIRERTSQLVKSGDVDALDAQEAASMQVRQLYEGARRTFRTESRRLYENVDPEEAVTGRLGPLYDQADDLVKRATLSFDQRDLPASLRDFERSIKARATQPVRRVGTEDLFPSSAKPDDQLELQQFIRRHGGINLSAETELGSEFEALIRNRETGTTGLFRQNGGVTPAEMAERAADAGFTFEADKFELLDAIRESMKTGRTYSIRNATAFGDPIDDAYLAADTAVIQNADDLRDVDVSLNDLKSLRSHILRDSRSQTGPDAANKRRILHQFRSAVETRMEGLAREQGRPDVMERLTQANRFYRQNINKFSTGAGERILRQRNGAYRVSNAQVIREFLKTPEDAAQFVDGIGNRQSALEAIESYLDADLYLKAVNTQTGRLSTAQTQKFLRDRNSMLRMFPELRERYQNMAQIERKVQAVEDASKRVSQRATRRVAESEELLDAQEQAANAQASVRVQRQRLSREPGQAILKATLDNGGIAQIMRRSDANDQLVRLANTMRDNPQARQGIVRTMWQVNDKPLTVFLNRYSPTLSHIYGPEHVANLQKISEGLRISRAADRSPVQMGSPTAELFQGQRSFLRGAARAAMPISMPIASLKLRLLRFAGRSALNYIQSAREEALRTITQEILYDPDISKTFAMLRESTKGKQAGIRLKAHMLMLGAENRFDDPEGEE